MTDNIFDFSDITVSDLLPEGASSPAETKESDPALAPTGETETGETSEVTEETEAKVSAENEEDTDSTTTETTEQTDPKPEEKEEEKPTEEASTSEPAADANIAKVRAWGKDLESQLRTLEPVAQLVNEIGGERVLTKTAPLISKLYNPDTAGTELLQAVAEINPQAVQAIAWAAVEQPQAREVILGELFGEGTNFEDLKAAWEGRSGGEGDGTGKDATSDENLDADLDYLPDAIRDEIIAHRQAKRQEAAAEAQAKQAEAQQKVMDAAIAFDNECASAIDKIITEYQLDVSDTDDEHERNRKEFAGLLTRMGATNLYFADQKASTPYANAKKMIVESGAAQTADDLKPAIHSGLGASTQKIAAYFNRLIADSRELQRLRGNKIAGTRTETAAKSSAPATTKASTKTKSTLMSNDGTADDDFVAELADALRQQGIGR